MVVGESNRASNIMDGIENTGDVRLHDHRLRLKQRFDIVRKLGQGTYGKVQLGINKKTGQEVAIKTIKKCKIETEADLVRIRREVQIMSSVRHPNIVHIYEVFENSEKMILVMEYCSGGELYDYLSQRKVLQEEEARRLFRQIATAVYYCHIHKICHRDLKLENVLLDETGSAKIADFGLSNVFKETSLLSTFCGSPLYASPEIVKGTPYIGPEVDCWSLGVLLYTLVYGAMPFDGSNFKRLVRQISNGDYYEPKNPSTASPLIRDMLTVDPVKRADIAYICDHPWVNANCESSCLERSEALAAETPVRLDLLLSLAPANDANALVMDAQNQMIPEEGGDMSNSAPLPVEPSNSAEKRILDLVAEGGEDAIKPSPTRTIVSSGEHKRKLELAISNSGLHRKKERVASSAAIPSSSTSGVVFDVLPTDETQLDPVANNDGPASPDDTQNNQVTLTSSATMTISPSPSHPEPPKEEKKRDVKTKIVKKKSSPTKTVEKVAQDKVEDVKQAETKPISVAAAADKISSLSLNQTNNQTPKPKKLNFPSGHVGSFKEQFERRASLTNAPEPKKNVTTKTTTSKIAKPKAQSEDRELSKSNDNSSVRLQQIGIQPSSTTSSEATQQFNVGGVKKTESEPSHSTAVDTSVLLQDARRSLQNSMAKLVEEKAEDNRRKAAARDIISSAIRKPPVPYGRSSSLGVSSSTSSSNASQPRVYRTEASHRVDDHRNSNRGVSVERIIPIRVAEEEPEVNVVTKQVTPPVELNAKVNSHAPVRRLVSSESSTSEACSTAEPIKKSSREFIIPIAVEGKGLITPRQGSLEPEANRTRPKGRRISLVSGDETEEDDDAHKPHRLRSSRLARAESLSSGEEEEDEDFHLLTAENLFSTLLHRVRALTNRLNGEDGPGFPKHTHSLFNNLQTPFFNSPHFARRHNQIRENWGRRDLHSDFDSMFNKSRQNFPRGSIKKPSKQQNNEQLNTEETVDSGLDLSDLDLSTIQFSDKQMEALSGLTPALSRRLQKQLLAHLPPAAARSLRRTLSMQNTMPKTQQKYMRSHSASKSVDATDDMPNINDTMTRNTRGRSREIKSPEGPPLPLPTTVDVRDDEITISPPPFLTLPRVKRHSTLSRETTPLNGIDNYDLKTKISSLQKEFSNSRASSIRSTPDRPLLQKYLPTPDRTLSLDDSYSSDTCSILSEPSYIAAYGGPSSLRRPSLRMTGDQTKKRVSRFLRPDFYDTPPDESIYAKHKKEKELETQKILKEIRERKMRSFNKAEDSDSTNVLKDDLETPIKCLSPVSMILNRDRSRSTTPFLPMLDNIKENQINKIDKSQNSNKYKNNEKLSKLMRPKSYPVKSLDSNDHKDEFSSEPIETHRTSQGKIESKLIRPRSYPTSESTAEINTNTQSTIQVTENREPKATNDIEVSFNISLPKKNSIQLDENNEDTAKIVLKSNLSNEIVDESKKEATPSESNSISSPEILDKSESKSLKTSNLKISEDANKKTVKKKVIRKVSSKTKSDANDEQKTTDKKKVTVKKVKEKPAVGSVPSTTTKKKSVLQSIGQKLEKLTTKSGSPEKNKASKVEESKASSDKKVASSKIRNQREQSVPINIEPPNEIKPIKRAATITDVAALDTNVPNKTTVSKVLGLFKKSDKDKCDKRPKSDEKAVNLNCIIKSDINNINNVEIETPKRPTSLLLNGLSRKKKYGRTTSDSITLNSHVDLDENKKESEPKKNNMKLDFSKLPRVKKIVPTNSVIEPQIGYSDNVNGNIAETNGASSTAESLNDIDEMSDRSRSRSRSNFSNAEIKPEHVISLKVLDEVTPRVSNKPEDTEDIFERIKRKSFYSRFNEKKHRRKSSLVGPGAAEYDPLARIHSPNTNGTYDKGPTQSFDSSVSSIADLSSPSDRYRSLGSEMPLSPVRNNIDNFKFDKPDTYRSLDRNNLRKFSKARSYQDYDYDPYAYSPTTRYNTMSMVGSTNGTEDYSMSYLREPHKYNRTISMYSPGSYATYRPKRYRNSAILLKDEEREPSPENILDKIRQRKKNLIESSARPDFEKYTNRSDITSQGEGDSAECSQKID